MIPVGEEAAEAVGEEAAEVVGERPDEAVDPSVVASVEATDRPGDRAGGFPGDRAAGTPGDMAESIQALDQEMTVLARRFRRILGERARAVHPELQVPGLLVLGCLDTAGPCRSADVIDTLGLDKGAVSRQVQHLLDLGLVERRPDPADGRAALLSLTPVARQHLQDLASHRRTAIEQRLAGWSADDLASFVYSLRRYNRALG